MVRHILDKAWHSPITRQDMDDICRAYGFQESALSIIPKLTDGTWALLEEQDKHTFTSRLEHAVPTVPLTNPIWPKCRNPGLHALRAPVLISQNILCIAVTVVLHVRSAALKQ